MDEEGISVLKQIEIIHNLELSVQREAEDYAFLKSVLSTTQIDGVQMDLGAQSIHSLIEMATTQEISLNAKTLFIHGMQKYISTREVKCCHCGDLCYALMFEAHWKDCLENLRQEQIPRFVSVHGRVHRCLLCVGVGHDAWFASNDDLIAHKKDAHMEREGNGIFHCRYCPKHNIIVESPLILWAGISLDMQCFSLALFPAVTSIF